MSSHLAKDIRLVVVAFVLISCLSSGVASQGFSFQARAIEIFEMPSNDTCTSEVPFPNPDDCTIYWQCFFVNNIYYIIEFQCPAGGIFDNPSGTCVTGTCDVITTEEPTTVEEPTTTEEPATTTEEPATTTEEPATTTEEPATTTEEPATTEEPTTMDEITTEVTTDADNESTTIAAPQLPCTANITYIHPDDPAKYYQCIQIEGQWYTYVFTCPQLSCFNPSTRLCTPGFCPMTTTVADTTTANTTPDTEDTTIQETSSTTEEVSSATEDTPSSNDDTTTNEDTTPTNADTTPTTTPIITTPVTTAPPDLCTTVGTFPNSVNCTMYYKCMMIGGSLVKYSFSCPSGSYFNAATKLCTVGTCSPPTTPSTPATTVLPSITSLSTSTTLIPSPPPPPIPSFTCSTPGYFPDPDDCTTYYYCLPNGANWYIFVFHCSPGSHFSPSPVAGCLIGACQNGTTEGNNATTEMTTTAVTTTVVPQTTTAAFTCTTGGRFPNPSICTDYYVCQANGAGGFDAYPFTCPGLSYFDPPSGNCYVGTC